MQDLLLATKYLLRDLLDDPQNWVLYGMSLANTKNAAAENLTRRKKIWENFWLMCVSVSRTMLNLFSVHQAVELGDKALKDGKRVVFGLFDTGTDMRHEAWAMFGKKRAKNEKDAVVKSLMGVDEVGDPADRVGGAGSVAGVGDEEDDLLADGAAAGNANNAKAGGFAPKSKGGAAMKLKQPAGIGSTEDAIGGDALDDVTLTALMRIAKEKEAAPQNATTERRKKHYTTQLEELRTLTDPDQDVRKWREGGTVKPHEIVPSLLLQNLCDKLTGYRVDTYKKTTSVPLLQAATEVGQKRIDEIIEVG